MAFIRRSGITPLLDALRRHCERGRPLRVLTTTYTGSTEATGARRARRARAPTSASRTTPSTTRLHAKAWLFHRRLGLLDRVHRLVEPDPLRAGDRPRVERPRLRRRATTWSTRSPPSSRATGTAATSSPYDPRRVRCARRAPSDPAPTVPAEPDRAAARAFQERLLEQIALSRERRATTATCSSRRPAPARR